MSTRRRPGSPATRARRALLERIVADWAPAAPAGEPDLEAARASLEYWRGQAADRPRGRDLG